MRVPKHLASDRKHVLMISVEWTKLILMGAIGGAMVLAVVGFGSGSWVTSGIAEEMANDRADSAVVPPSRRFASISVSSKLIPTAG